MKNLTHITLDLPNITDFAAARNAALAKAKTEWVLFLDSDEKLTPALENEISSIVHRPSSIYNAYSLKRLDTFLGRELHHGETGHSRFIRLARHDFGQWVRPVHEVWTGQGKVGQLMNPILHTPHPTISSFLAKINHYSTIEAQYRYGQRIRSSLFKIAFYPLAKFILNYLLRLGFLDGAPGLIMALMMSFHSYLTWTKLYILWHKK